MRGRAAVERRDVACTVKPGMLPFYSSEGASGADLRADITDTLILKPGERAAIPTGLRLELPRDLEAQVRPRSGLALRFGVTVLNTPGTIDADYRGEIKVILINLGSEEFTIKRGDRIAQIAFLPVVRVRFRPTGEIGETSRGEAGFGSTGL